MSAPVLHLVDGVIDRRARCRTRGHFTAIQASSADQCVHRPDGLIEWRWHIYQPCLACFATLAPELPL